ncbi:unnamed protein product [Ilex paraguariensis]|uniref:Uncharacterized protein n=1 Tax=Ilex paraguariensis TaxID=185542 RepID=A0ABC8TKM7_9AQUA
MKTVNLSECPRLQQIQWPSVVVEKLYVIRCRSLKSIIRLSLLMHLACPSLCYVQSAFKIEDVGKVDLQVINSIGFFNLESMANVDLMIVNIFLFSKMRRPAQVLSLFLMI